MAIPLLIRVVYAHLAAAVVASFPFPFFPFALAFNFYLDDFVEKYFYISK